MLTKLRTAPQLKNEGLAVNLIRQLAISTGPQVIDQFIRAGVCRISPAFLFEIETMWLSAATKTYDQTWAVKLHIKEGLRDAN